jgi:hypothetical protein
MTKPNAATERGLSPHYKVRVVLPGAILHLASRTEPKAEPGQMVKGDWIVGPDYGDTIGFVDWTKVIAVTWRYAP